MSSANETLDYFVLLRSMRYDMIKYSHGKGEVIYKPYEGSVDILVDGTPKFVLFNLQREDDKVEFCLKVSTKSTTNGGGQIHYPDPECAKIELLGKVCLYPLQ